MNKRMEKSVRKWLKMVLLTVFMPLAVACSAGDDADDSYLSEADMNSITSSGIYEGEWTVNRQVVDTARLVVAESLRVRLPERYLLGLCFPGSKDKGEAAVEPLNVPTTIQVHAQGYSDQSQYMSFVSATTQATGTQFVFNTCSFDATVNGMPCRISLQSKENASAILQYGTTQWTLAIPVNSIVITNQATGQTTRQELDVAVTLYYNTKKRIG